MLVTLIVNKAELERIFAVVTPEKVRVDVRYDAWTRAGDLIAHVHNEAKEDAVFDSLNKYANSALKRALKEWLQIDLEALVTRAKRPANRQRSHEVDVSQKNIRAACKQLDTPAYIYLEDYDMHEKAPIEVFISTVIAAVAERDIMEGRKCTNA